MSSMHFCNKFYFFVNFVGRYFCKFCLLVFFLVYLIFLKKFVGNWVCKYYFLAAERNVGPIYSFNFAVEADNPVFKSYEKCLGLKHFIVIGIGTNGLSFENSM